MAVISIMSLYKAGSHSFPQRCLFTLRVVKVFTDV